MERSDAVLGGLGDSKAAQRARLEDMLWHLVLNHSVVPEHRSNGEMRYSASSPDEEALVAFAGAAGLALVDRKDDCVTIEVGLRRGDGWFVQTQKRMRELLSGNGGGGGGGGERVRCVVLHIVAYNQVRKRMSVVVRLPDGRLMLFCKGADSALFARLRAPQGEEEVAARRRTQKTLAAWGRSGLRTLVFGCRTLSEEELSGWSDRWVAACASITERRKRKEGEPNAIDDLAEELERDLVLQGATAVEDRLQPGVPETIALLARAGVKTWVLTGDKVETAVTVGYAAQLLDDRTPQIMAAAGDEAGGAARGAAAVLALASRRGFDLAAAYSALADEAEMDPTVGSRGLSGLAQPLTPVRGGGGEDRVAVMQPPRHVDLPRRLRPPGPCSRLAFAVRTFGAWCGRAMRTLLGAGPSADIDALLSGPALAVHLETLARAADNEIPKWMLRVLPSFCQRPPFAFAAASAVAPSRFGAGDEAYTRLEDDAGGYDSPSPSPSPSVSALSPSPGVDGGVSGSWNPYLEAASSKTPGEVVPTSPGLEGLREGGRPTKSGRVAVILDERVLDVLLGASVPTKGRGEDAEEWDVAADLAAARGHGKWGTVADDLASSADSIRGAVEASVRSLWGSVSAERAAAEVEDGPDVSLDAAVASHATSLLTDSKVQWLLRADTPTAARLRRAALLAALGSASAVLACRCRPDQKAALVRLVARGRSDARCLAIGDGANDVPMIRAAHVGVGISGREGASAANASDYAVARFRFLARLLLVHGRNNARRVAKLVCYMVYKCLVLYGAQTLFSIRSAGSSGQKFFPEYPNQLYNVLYTSLPVLVLATTDTDVSPTTALRLPQLFRESRGGVHMSTAAFLSWILSATVDAVLAYGISTLALERADAPGQTPAIFELGTLVFTSVLLLVSLRVAAEMHAHSPLFIAALLVSMAVWPPSLALFDSWDIDRMRGTAHRLVHNASFWFALPLVAVLGLGRTALARACKRSFFPAIRHVADEQEHIAHNIDSLVAVGEAAFRASGTLLGGFTVPPAPQDAPILPPAARAAKPHRRRRRHRLRGAHFAIDTAAAEYASEHFSSAGVAARGARRVHTPGSPLAAKRAAAIVRARSRLLSDE